MRKIYTELAPDPAGNYAQAMVVNGFAFVSGQLPVDSITKEKKTTSIEEQTRQALQNVLHIVEAAGGSLTSIVKVTIFVTNIDLWLRVNRSYLEFFGDHRPARSMVPIGNLHHGYQVEIEAVAAIGE
jgi:2-iminobutanoate/2-iminopropanoate deaminase